MQVNSLLIADNSETAEARKNVESASLCLQHFVNGAAAGLKTAPQVVLHPADANLGLSAAYNLAIERARIDAADYLLLLDQDSVVAHDMVQALVTGMKRGAEQANEFGKRCAPAAVGPWYTDELSGRRSVVLRTGKWLVNYIKTPQLSSEESLLDLPLMPTEMLISSGSLVSMEAFDTFGELDASLFIDHIDTDWCLRVHHGGGWMAVVPAAQMRHRLGDRVLRLWFKRWRLLPVHNPVRLYYTFRNSLWLYRRPYAHWRWILFDLKRLLAVTLIHTLAAGPRLQRFKMIARGLLHGITGRRKP